MMLAAIRSSTRHVARGLVAGHPSPACALRAPLPSPRNCRVISNCGGCSGCTQSCNAMKRSISTNPTDSSATESVRRTTVIPPPMAPLPVDIFVAAAKESPGSVEVQLSSGKACSYPSTWLRDNCQCSDCFNHQALGRSLLMKDLEIEPSIKSVHATPKGTLQVGWTNGHQSEFEADWLQKRSFDDVTRSEYRKKFQLPKVEWGRDHSICKLSYPSVMADDRALLEWLVKVETEGAVLLQGVPARPDAAYDLCERIAKVKYTHFGVYSNVVNHPNANNLAYTSQSLSLHNDMPQYQEIPGLIFLHMVRQHRAAGGDTVISDGLRAAHQMRDRHPDHFRTLTSTDVYFWDKGASKDDLEPYNFYKINKGPIIQLDNNDQVTIIRFNNQVRDSFLDLPLERVNHFYAAMKIYFDLMYEISVTFKMEDGDMTVLDNVRCQHGRQGFTGDMNSRHLATTFMTWDEALCRRRRLQEEFGE